MSISSMTNGALARRPDFPPFRRAPTDLHEMARLMGGPSAPPPVPDPPNAATPSGPGPTNAATNALQVIAAYIPTEILSLYVACISVLHHGEAVTRGEWIAFWSFLAATPATVWLVFAIKLQAAGRPLPLQTSKWPVWEMSAATIAYVAWAYALPGTPFSELKSYSPGIAGFLVLIVSAVLGLVAQLFQRPLKDK